MNFITKEDLKSTIYGYQVDQITEGDDVIVEQAIDAAIQECRSYLSANINKKENQDGRFLYDVEKIFNATGKDRNALIVQYCITIAKWYIVDLSNADIIMEQAKERYDRVLKSLTNLSKGETTLSNLPIINITDELEESGVKPFRFGSRPKFHHE